MIRSVCHWWIVALWVAFVIYWGVTAVSLTRALGRSVAHRRRGITLFHAALIAVILILFELVRHSHRLRELHFAAFRSVPLAVAGAILATAGALLAFSARATIGRNWATPATERTDTELVTTGPYRFVRHPIYGGMLVMIVGTEIGLSPLWLPIAIVAAIYFVVSARAEERHMMQRFPDSYPAYRARTRMLLPFLL